jgi:hypothetical protein
VISEPADKAAEAGSFPGPIRRGRDPDLAATYWRAGMTKKFLATATQLAIFSERCRDESNKVESAVSRSTDPKDWARSLLATSLSKIGDIAPVLTLKRLPYKRYGAK